MNKIGYIYKITSPSGRIYIGLTNNIKERLQAYKYGASKSQPFIRNSILKYGWLNHTYEILEKLVCSKKDLESLEMGWIAHYKSNRTRYPEHNGLNLTDGGCGAKGREVSEETRIKIGLAHKGKIIPRELVEKLIQSRKGKPHPNLGKKGIHTKEGLERISFHSKNRPVKDETRKKCSEASKGRIVPPHVIEQQRVRMTGNTYCRGKSFRQLLDTTTGVYFDSLREASVAYVIPYKYLSRFLCEGNDRKNKTNLIYV